MDKIKSRDGFCFFIKCDICRSRLFRHLPEDLWLCLASSFFVGGGLSFLDRYSFFVVFRTHKLISSIWFRGFVSKMCRHFPNYYRKGYAWLLSSWPFLFLSLAVPLLSLFVTPPWALDIEP